MTFKIIIISVSFILGMLTLFLINRFNKWLDKKKKIKEVSSIFREISSNISLGKSEFVTLVNDILQLSTNTIDFGNVGVLVFLEKKEISIYKGDNKIYTSKDLDTEDEIELIESINSIYSKHINDTVEVYGLKFNKTSFEKQFGESLDKLKKEEESDTQKISNENSKKFDIDEILDKISEVGYNNLTDDEKDFLSKF
jgi:hypothetical protein